jgi:hypothetical protein
MSNCPFCLREDFIIQFVNCIQGVFSKDEKCVVRRDFSLCLRNSLLIFNVPVMFFPSPKHSKLNRGRRGRDEFIQHQQKKNQIFLHLFFGDTQTCKEIPYWVMSGVIFSND